VEAARTLVLSGNVNSKGSTNFCQRRVHVFTACRPHVVGIRDRGGWDQLVLDPRELVITGDVDKMLV
jgi:hypothetical protein